MSGRPPIEADNPRSLHTSIRLGPRQAAKLSRLAEQQGLSRAQLIRIAVTDLLAKLEEDDVMAS